MQPTGSILHRRAATIAALHFAVVVALFILSLVESSTHSAALRASGETPASPFFRSVFVVLLPVAWLLRALGAEFSLASFVPVAVFAAVSSALLYGYVIAFVSLYTYNHSA